MNETENKKNSAKKSCQNKFKKIWLVLCCLFLFVSIITNISNNNKLARIEKIKAIQETEEDGLKKSIENGEKKNSFSQNRKLQGIVLLNVGEKSKKNISSKDIHNIICIVFAKNNKKQIVNIVAVEKDECVRKKKGSLITVKDTFDKKNPKKMYKAIEKIIDYKVDSYIAYNNDTIKEIVELIYVVNLNIAKIEHLNIDDKQGINNELNRLKEEYSEKDIRKISDYGWQALNSVQAVAYSNLYYNKLDCCDNDWRQLYLIAQIIEGIKDANYLELDKIRDVINDGDHKIDGNQSLLVEASIKMLKKMQVARCSWNLNYITIDAKRYAVSSDQLFCLNYLHKTSFKEKDYKPSSVAERYIKTLEEIKLFIANYFEEKAAEKETNNNSSNYRDRDDIYSNNSSGKATQKNKNSNKKNEDSKPKQRESSDPVAPTPELQPEPEQTVDPEPQSEDSNVSDGAEE